MGQRAYCRALELRLNDLATQISVLKRRCERMEGINRLRCGREIQRLEQRHHVLRNRLLSLEREKSGLWTDLKADIRGFTGELPSMIEQWVEYLDANYAPPSPRLQKTHQRRAEDHSSTHRDRSRRSR